MEAPPSVLPCLNAPLLVICGSLNPITKRQLDYATKNGGIRISLDPSQMQAGYSDSEAERLLYGMEKAMRGGRDILIDTVAKSDEDTVGLRDATARQLGVLTKELLGSQVSRQYLPMIIGGDTLLVVRYAPGGRLHQVLCFLRCRSLLGRRDGCFRNLADLGRKICLWRSAAI